MSYNSRKRYRQAHRPVKTGSPPAAGGGAAQAREQAGPGAEDPLRAPVSAPSRARLGALVRVLVDELPRRAVTIKAAGHLLTLRGHAAVVDGELPPCPSGGADRDQHAK
ncbi:hypothetical protein Vqi01_13500 [Micromonospora qiuiae]|uniref:Uncharacterized protein n=1 Tax=Micromonospora qiuiae TaxID=502268 RepID=A0ABQ4J7N9_9ACTN|nr:hypothetical protein Vqi01_13500 [Micromonospora qiuiae]